MLPNNTEPQKKLRRSKTASLRGSFCFMESYRNDNFDFDNPLVRPNDIPLKQEKPSSIVTTATVDAVGGVSDIRLIQYRPAWALHAFLRFLDLPYTCQNILHNAPLGFLTPPSLITGQHSFSQPLAFEYLHHKVVGKEIEYESKMWTTYIEANIVSVFNELMIRGDGNNEAAQRAMRWNIIERAADFVNGEMALSSSRPVSVLEGVTTADLLIRLEKEYSFLNDVEAGCGFLKGGQSGSHEDEGIEGMGLHNAVLFGHLAEALSVEHTASLVGKFPNLTNFFQKVMDDYFSNPISDINAVGWKLANKSLLENGFLLRGISKDKESVAALTKALKGDDGDDVDAELSWSGANDGDGDATDFTSVNPNFLSKEEISHTANGVMTRLFSLHESESPLAVDKGQDGVAVSLAGGLYLVAVFACGVAYALSLVT